MSPLGPLSVFPLLPSSYQSLIDSNSLSLVTEATPLLPQHQFLRLMTLSLGKESSAAAIQRLTTTTNHLLQHPNYHAVTLGKSRSKMTLKMNHPLHSHGHGNNGISNNSSKGLLHSIRNYILPDPVESCQVTASSPPTQDERNEDDEVLSIGRDNDGESSHSSGRGHRDIDLCKESPSPPNCRDVTDDDDDGDIDVDDSMSTVTTTTSQSQSPSPSSSSLQSPTPSFDTRDGHNFRLRSYSSEDSTLKSYNPLSSLSEAFINNSLQQQQQRHHQASLFFSIANILRPDFGLGRLPLSLQHVPPPSASSIPGIGFLPHHNNSQSHSNHTHQYQQRPTAKRGKIHSDGRGDLPHKKCKSAKLEPVIPIDLSRPSLLDSPPKKSSNHVTNKSTNHHRNGGNSSKVVSPGNPQHPHVKKQEPKNGKVTLPSPLPQEGSKGSLSDEKKEKDDGETIWPAWVYCTRYSDRPSSGPRTRRGRKQKEKEIDEKRPRTAFTAEQLSRLKKEFDENRYLTEKRRQDLANDLRLHENQIKIWFQNKRAKLKKSTGTRGGLALQLMAQGLYNHSTIPPRGCGDEDDEESE